MNSKATRIAIAICSIGGLVIGGSEATNWSRSITPLSSGARAFSADVAGCSFGHCYIVCGFENEGSKQIEIAGVLTKEGKFYARAELFVAKMPDGDWKQVSAKVQLGKATTIVLKPYSHSQLIYIDVDPLIPLIGKANYAKVVVSSGDTAEFAIRALTQ